MKILQPVANLFDALHHFWDHPKTEKRVAVVLIAIFLVSLGAIELKRRAWLPGPLAGYVPGNHFHAVNLAFSMLLVLEVASLIFMLASSVTRSLGKQLEILTLILLRNAFKALSHMHEPIDIIADWQPALHILASSAGALVIFICIGVYYRIHRYQGYLKDPVETMRYVMTKKLLAIVLLFTFIGVGGVYGWQYVAHGLKQPFFETFYTILIFADILLVLIAQRYMPGYHAVFRNSGYLVATLFMRIALSAPPFFDAATGIVAALFTLGVTYATNIFHYGALAGPEEISDK